MSERNIGKMTLRCEGGFTCQLVIHWRRNEREPWQSTSRSDRVPLGQKVTWDPGDHGVPDGALVYLEAVVNAGKDKSASEHFRYVKGELSSVTYRISGTTLINSLKGPDYLDVDKDSLKRLGFVKLESVGAFVCSGCFCWFDSAGNIRESENIQFMYVDQSTVMDPGALGVPDGSVCFLKAIVVAGIDRSSPSTFVYQKGSKDGWVYTLGGTTVQPYLSDPRPTKA